MKFARTRLLPAISIDQLISFHYFEYASGFVFDGEHHDFWEFLYVDKGQVQVQADDRTFELELRSFFYLPFMHSESQDDQERCVELFSLIPESASASWAEHHCEIIRRFGRFPHRNRLLGRDTTPEEQQWLDHGGFQG